MKSLTLNLAILSIALLIIILSSCRQNSDRELLPGLKHIEAIMYHHPDSALMLLEQMPVPSTSDKLQHATWCLFITQARYKNDVVQESDSLINIAYNYFIEQDDPQRKALTLYLIGSLNEERDDAEKATQYYLAAAKEVERADDYQLGYLIYAYMGNIYLYRELYEYGEEAHLKAHEYAKLSGNQIYISSSLSHIARIYTVRKDWNEATRYYQEAADIARINNDQRTLSIALGELSVVYTYVPNYDLALQYAKQTLAIDEKENLPTEATLLGIGDIYRLTGQKDSAYYYLHKATESSTIYTKRSAYQALYYLSRDSKDYAKALEYADKFYIYNDSAQQIDRSRILIEMQEKYNQEKVLNEKKRIQIEKDRIVHYSLIGTILLLCIIGLLIFIYQCKLIQKQRTIQTHEEKIRLYIMKVHRNEEQITRNENRIRELIANLEQNLEIKDLLEEQQNAIVEIQNHNEALRRENQKLHENITQYSTALQRKKGELDSLKELSVKNLYLQERENFLCKELVKRIKVLNDLKVAPKCLDIIQWEGIIELINWLYEDFTKRLTKEIPQLTESDVRICCLLKLRLGIREIAALLGISPASVSKRKLRVKERIAQQTKNSFDENQTLDLWVWEY